MSPPALLSICLLEDALCSTTSQERVTSWRRMNVLQLLKRSAESLLQKTFEKTSAPLQEGNNEKNKTRNREPAVSHMQSIFEAVPLSLGISRCSLWDTFSLKQGFRYRRDIFHCVPRCISGTWRCQPRRKVDALKTPLKIAAWEKFLFQELEHCQSSFLKKPENVF